MQTITQILLNNAAASSTILYRYLKRCLLLILKPLAQVQLILPGHQNAQAQAASLSQVFPQPDRHFWQELLHRNCTETAFRENLGQASFGAFRRLIGKPLRPRVPALTGSAAFKSIQAPRIRVEVSSLRHTPGSWASSPRDGAGQTFESYSCPSLSVGDRGPGPPGPGRRGVAGLVIVIDSHHYSVSVFIVPL
jgi:hypothetical protein